MSISAWILIGLTFVVTVVLLPQVAKSRRMMGQARHNDRFSEGMRLLEVEDAPSPQRSVEVAIYRTSGNSDDKPVTRPIKTAQDLRQYTNLKAQRAAAASTRANAARRRAYLLIMLLVAGALVAGFATAGLLAWWVLSAPVVGIIATLAWGTISAGNGRKEDLQLIADIREVERRLEKSPTGRAALISGRNRDNNHWAKVARESLRENAPEGTLSEALQRSKTQAESGSATPIANSEQLVQKSELAPHEAATTPAKAASETEPDPAKDRSDRDTIADATDGFRDTKKWDFVGIPAPTYTLRSDAARREVTVSTEATDSGWEEAPVPMRPKSAQILPAGEALSSEEIQENNVNLQNILDRRRA